MEFMRPEIIEKMNNYKIPIRKGKKPIMYVNPPIKTMRIDGWKRLVVTLSNDSIIKIPKRIWEKGE